MTHKLLRRGMLVAAMLATLAMPSESRACWFTSCFSHTATYAPAPAPTYAAYAPVTACYNPCSTCNTCNSCGSCGTTCGYAPQTSYMPVTTYQPVTTLSPVTSGGGCCLCPWFGGSTTSYRQVTSYVPQTSYMPVTSYAPACTTNYCNTCSTGCSTCSTGCSSCSTGCSSCGGGGCSTCGTTTGATTTFYQSAPSTSYQPAPSMYQPAPTYQPSSSGCSTCNASASAPVYSSRPSSTYASSPAASGAVSTFQSGAAATSAQMPLTPLNNPPTQSVQKPIPDAKSDGGAAQNKQMSDPAPRLLDPARSDREHANHANLDEHDRRATVSEVRQASGQSAIDDTDADGWHAPRGR